MAEEEKRMFADMSESANALATSGHEGVLLAITASYLAGKEAGRREASKEAVQPGA